MRPLTLKLEGFTAFREPTCLDFTDLDLFAITGPTGAGKSSLIDAIGYALYGKVSRVPNIGACISQGMSRTWVELEFLAGADQYRVHRETRVTGQPSIRLERWNGLDWVLSASGARPVVERIEAIVGLDFDGFTRSVLLPQGRFQEFLAGDPSKRREVLSGLLRLEVYQGVRRRAEMRRGELQARMRALQDVLDTAYRDANPDTIADLARELKALRAREAALAERVERLGAAREMAQAVTRARAQLDSARAQLRDLASKRKAAEALVAEGGVQVAGLEEQLKGVDREIAGVGYDGDLTSALAVALRLFEELGRAAADHARAEAAVSEHALAQERLTTTEAEAADALAAARLHLAIAGEERQRAVTTNAAAVVQRDLKSGDACPVCGQAVGALPHIACPDLSEAEGALEGAADAERAGAVLLARVSADRQVAAAQRQEAERAAEQYQAALTRLAAEIKTTLAGHAWTREQAAEEIGRQQEAQRRLTRLHERRQEVQAILQSLEKDLAAARATLTALEGQEQGVQDVVDRAEAELDQALACLREAAKGTDWGAGVAGLDAGPPLEAAIQAVLQSALEAEKETQNQIGQIGQRLEDLRQKVEEKQGLEKELAGHKARFDVVDDLARVMRADRFGAFVQSEALRVLAEQGSRRLEALSTGRYRLQVSENQQDFDVVDQWNADEARSVRTLSGGETFLASLALALTMAESLPNLAPGQRVALDSIFIDEGFGSLDAEALERAAEALDALRAENRLVCVITHLKELAERMPARIEVLKGEAGSRVEVR
ncbi:MAG: SMC family ATPase [Chloroflexi bacterium]|nr:SMC family ATPase [Chloroflexota bacterium]